MRTGCNELCDGMRQCAEGVDVEDGERVLAIVHATLRENNGNKVDAGGAEER